MAFRTVAVILISLLFTYSLPGQSSKRDILTGSISKERLELFLTDRQNFRPVPPLEDPFWASIDIQLKKLIIENGERFLNYDWPSLLARRYMDFDIDGNRTRFSERYYARRNALADLCMAEILENNGRFMDDIINGTWLILEETTWVVPAHSGGNKLHDFNDVEVDLFSAETAGLLAWIDYYFGQKFDELTPLIRERIYAEVDRRVIQSMLDHNDFWYMGYTGRIPNNWNPWIVSNWLTAVLLLEEDIVKRTESVWKAMDVLDQYLNPHPADGGCDEGPGYWGHAGASLFDCLFLLNIATEGEVDIFDLPLIRNIGNYIHKIHISDNWYVNFADGSALNNHPVGTIYRIGKSINDRTMMAMAAEQYRKNPGAAMIPEGRSPFGLRKIPNLMVMDETAGFSEPYIPELQYFFPDLEVVVARQNQESQGFFMAIKGGFNNESHNHNDAGSFVLFYNGLPLLVDAGVGTYTKKTFSSERYTIWTMQSAYHNLPTLNGEMQADGDNYKAEDFMFENSSNRISVSMDISGAYPEHAWTESCNRNLELNRRTEKIRLTDQWSQERQLARNQWHFMLAHQPKSDRKGSVRITNGKDNLYLKFSNHFTPKIERIELEDERLRSVWGDSLWRLTLTTGKKGLNGKETFTIQK